MKEEINNLMSELDGKDKIYAHQTDILYRLYNELFPDLKEWNKACDSCRIRVYNAVRDWWLNNKNN